MEILFFVEREQRGINYTSPITGEIIKIMFEINSGKEVGSVLSKLREEIIEGRIQSDYDSAVKYLNILKKNRELL